MSWVTPKAPRPPDEDPDPHPQPPEPTDEAAPDADSLPEPPVEPLEDTSPSLPIRPVRGAAGPPLWRQGVGLLMLLAAAALTLAAGGLVFLPSETSTPPATTAPEGEVPSPTATTLQPTAAPPALGVASLPTLDPMRAAELLSTPPYEVADASGAFGGAIPRQDSPFTIIPERARGEVITYIVQSGDTISGIAERYGLEMDSVGWCNTYSVVFALRPGTQLLIPPVDGVCHEVLVPESIAEVAARYQVEDPYTLINSEFNNFFGATPGTVLPSGTLVFVPGGVGNTIDWQYNPVVERSGPGGESGGGFISFAPGEPGSCGRQSNPGHVGFGSVPLASYSWSRGFSSFHTGVDLSAAVDTPVYAAAAGRVIYAGWNNWGYGNLVIVAHGPFTTLYGHLNSINVGCGQAISAGSVIGGVGTTGNSSGPHLHFEIRYNDVPTDPLLYFAF